MKRKFRFLEFFQEDNGNYSSMRLFTFIILCSAIIEWQKAIWAGGGTWHPDYAVIGLITGVLGVKVLQKRVENSGEDLKKDDQFKDLT
jgi:hypothetical protein